MCLDRFRGDARLSTWIHRIAINAALQLLRKRHPERFEPLDFEVEDLEAGIAWAKQCGASEAAYQPADRNLDRLRVLIDPAGHPFCFIC